MRTMRLLIILTCALPIWAVAQIAPIRDHNRLWGPRAETMVRVTSNKPDSYRVLIADYDLIRKDFLQTQKMTDGQIDSWLIENTSFISKNQAHQNVVTSDIPTNSETTIGYRPYEYHRGIVFEAKEGGLLDAVGTGAIHPAKKSHRTGTAILSDVLRKYFLEKLINNILKISASPYTTVGSYAVIDYGFQTWDPYTDKFTKAGYILRQAHRRSDSDAMPESEKSSKRISGVMLPENMAIEIEATLRKFGLTSAGSNRSLGFDTLNLQGTPQGAIVDTDAFLVISRFQREVRTSDGTKIVWKAGESPQPDLSLQEALKSWSYFELNRSGQYEPHDKLEDRLHTIVEQLEKGAIRKQHVTESFNLLMMPIRHLQMNVKRSCRQIFNEK